MKDDIIKKTPGFKFAITGLISAYQSERNFRIHLVFIIIVVLLGIYLSISKTEWLLITIATGLVLMAELFNSSIELIVDFISPEFDLKAGKIKDISAAAVLLAVITAVIIGSVIFVPYVFILII